MGRIIFNRIETDEKNNEKDEIIAALLKKNKQLEALVQQLTALTIQQAARIAELEKRLNKNSRNPHPVTD